MSLVMVFFVKGIGGYVGVVMWEDGGRGDDVARSKVRDRYV